MSFRCRGRGNYKSGRVSKFNRGFPGNKPGKPLKNNRYLRGRGYNRHMGYADSTNEPSTSRNVDSEYQENLEHLYGRNARIVDDSLCVGPYCGWNLYISDEQYNDSLPALVKIRALQDYYKRMGLVSSPDDIEDNKYFILNYKEIHKDEGILKVWPNFAKELEEIPEKCINYVSLAMHQVLSVAACEERKKVEMQLSENGSSNSFSNTVQNPMIPKVQARIIGFEPVLLLKNLKSNYYGKFVCVKGTIIRVSNVKPLCTKLAFKCVKCEIEFVYSQPYGKYTLPVKCATKACRSQVFNPFRNSTKTETVNWQSVRLQEITDNHEVGRMPRSVECELMHDLVDSCVPGDVVSISGIVNVTSSTEGKSKYNKDKCTFLLYILANSVSNNQNSEMSSSGKISTPVGLELTMKDLYAVQAIQAEENLYKLLCASLCPSIYGHEIVKAGLILGLFGGTQKFVGNKNRIPVRGDPHILVVGDPGLGKSQMLQACANIAPRGVYVCGNTTTTSGLTVTLTREGGGSGDYALEAGALVLADQGCCCIDEFDKMTSQHHALLEAMEQQTISIAKAGIVCSLPARTSILAAANPVGGHYNKGKTVSENLKIGCALLSRFDLVFILLDKPDQELDCKLSEHVMALHSGKNQRRNITASHLNITQSASTPKTETQIEREKPLTERLRYGQNEDCDPIPHQLLRKYIAYARKYVNAKISKEAANVLQKFYLELRRRLQTSDSTPITTRQLESLIRLTEARARLELRESCTKEDAMDVVEIMKQSMIDVWSDDFGVLDITRSQHGSGMSGRSQAKKFISVLTCVSERTQNSLFSMQQLKEIAKDAGLHILDFENLVMSLNTQGVLIKKGRGIYKLLSVDY